MAFWKQNNVKATRQFRFKLSIDGEDYWWAKSTELPSATVNFQEYLLGNHKFKYPGVLTWNPIQTEIADVGIGASSSALRLINIFENKGYVIQEGDPGPNTNNSGLEKVQFEQVRIEQLKPNGEPQQTWILRGAFFTEINFGRGDYNSEEINSITFTINYDYAEYLNGG